MSSHDVLSSEQALDDYFTALLGEEVEVVEPEKERDTVAQTLSSAEPEPKLQLKYAEPESYQFSDMYAPALEAPNLEDVQRLLSQLESVNPAIELDFSAESQPVEPDTKVEVHVAEIEEIQDWDIEEAPAYSTEADLPNLELKFDLESKLELETKLETETKPESETKWDTVESVASIVDIDVEAQHELSPKLETQAGASVPLSWENTQRTQDFQVLYFDVNGVTFAVPLDELGGIHRITELNHLIGRPAWYLGLQTGREQQFDVVDTAKWVMADKLVGEEYKENYQYVVMLGESMWGLASNQLMGTETLNIDKVRWREQAGKRPWLAGMVKEKMCALIHVQALIDMLNAGLDVKSMN